MKSSEQFPNGIDSYLETYYEVCTTIEHVMITKCSDVVNDATEKGGRTELYNLSETLTRKFETEHKGFKWGIDGEFLDEICSFIGKEL